MRHLRPGELARWVGGRDARGGEPVRHPRHTSVAQDRLDAGHVRDLHVNVIVACPERLLRQATSELMAANGGGTTGWR